MNIRLMPITINARHTLKTEGLQGSVYGDIELLQMKSKQWWGLGRGFNYDFGRTSRQINVQRQKVCSLQLEPRYEMRRNLRQMGEWIREPGKTLGKPKSPAHWYTKRVPIAWRLTSRPHKVIIVYLKSHDWVLPLFRSGLCIISSKKFSPWCERKWLLTGRWAWLDAYVWALAWLQISG